MATRRWLRPFTAEWETCGRRLLRKVMDSSKLAAAGSSWHQFACSSVHWSSRHDPDLRDSNTFETPACRAYRLLFVMIVLFPISHRNGYAIDQESTSRIATLRDSAEIKKQLPSSHIRANWSWSSVGIWVCLMFMGKMIINFWI